jgi:hypothetical protein
LIWDGAELYAIEPSADVLTMLDASSSTPTSDTVIFKLSDTTVELGDNYCAAADQKSAAGTGLAMYQTLTSDLPQQGDSNDAAPSLRLEMQVLVDAALRAEYDSDQAVIDAVAVRLNNVDGIYSAQLGLAIEATDIQFLGAANTGLSDSTDPGTLLNSLGVLRANIPGMNSYAATHLFTGRDLDGDTLGIAYIGNLCGARYAASLSELRGRGAWLDSLVAAHELGHQLGAVHDGTGTCSDTPSNSYLMSSLINGTDEFSACSRNLILNTMHRAACLVPINTPVSDGANNSDPSNATSVPADQGGGGGGGALQLDWLLLFIGFAGWRLRSARQAA